MRIAAVSEFNTSTNVGLSVGPIYASGGFGFVNRTSQESVFQASTRVALSNFEKNLKTYLENKGIQVTSVEELRSAIEFLQKS